MARIKWTQERLNEYMAANPGLTFQTPHLERRVKHAPKAKNARQKMGERVRVRCHSRRHRLTDPDAIYFKAVLDGLTEGGLLIDDSSRFVASIEHTQERISAEEQEETIITVEAYEELAR